MEVSVRQCTCIFIVSSLYLHQPIRLIIVTSGFRGGGAGGAPPFEIPKRVFKEGQRGRTPPAPPFEIPKRVFKRDRRCAPPPLSTNPGSAPDSSRLLLLLLQYIISNILSIAVMVFMASHFNIYVDLVISRNELEIFPINFLISLNIYWYLQIIRDICKIIRDIHKELVISRNEL